MNYKEYLKSLRPGDNVGLGDLYNHLFLKKIKKIEGNVITMDDTKTKYDINTGYEIGLKYILPTSLKILFYGNYHE